MPESPLDILSKIKEENLLAGLGNGDDLKLDEFKGALDKVTEACNKDDHEAYNIHLVTIVEKIGRWQISTCRKTNNIGKAIGYLAEAMTCFFERKEGQRKLTNFLIAALGVIGVAVGIIETIRTFFH